MYWVAGSNDHARRNAGTTRKYTRESPIIKVKTEINNTIDVEI